MLSAGVEREPLRVVVCGSRDWTDRETMVAWFRKLPADAKIAHGAARGADAMAGELAVEFGFAVCWYPADWRTHGRAAGPIRNREMLDGFKPDLVLAFTNTLVRDGRLSGTGDCVGAANERGIRCTIIPTGVLP